MVAKATSRMVLVLPLDHLKSRSFHTLRDQYQRDDRSRMTAPVPSNSEENGHDSRCCGDVVMYSYTDTMVSRSGYVGSEIRG